MLLQAIDCISKNLIKSISEEVTDRGEKGSKPILYHWSISVPMKTSGNQRFSDIFMGCRKTRGIRWVNGFAP